MTLSSPHCTVLGAGSFGTAMADLFCRLGYPTKLWTHRLEQATLLQESRANTKYTKNYRLPETLKITAHPDHAMRGAQLICVVVPTRYVRETLTLVAPHVPQDALILLCSKGLELETQCTMEQVACQTLGVHMQQQIMVLSGPSFAHEMLQQQPTAVMLAGHHQGHLQQTADLLFCDTFRVYTTTDVIGVQMAGAFKNVIAIAIGALQAMGYQHNTTAALITRGLAEMGRLVLTLGGKGETLAGLAGVGDLWLTCQGQASRNRRFGEKIGSGLTIAQAKQDIGQVVEGTLTALSLHRMANKLNIHAPITKAVYRVLYENVPCSTAMLDILRQKPHQETSLPGSKGKQDRPS